MKAILTGWGGQDCSCLTEILVSLNYQFILISRHSISYLYSGLDESSISTLSVLLCHHPFQSTSFWNCLFLEYRPELIFDFAAVNTSTKYMHKVDNSYFYSANLEHFNRIVSAFEAYTSDDPRPHFVTCGSSLIFGRNKHNAVVDESTLMTPECGYGLAKATIRQICSDMRQIGRNVSYTILFNHESRFRKKSFLVQRLIHHYYCISRGSTSPHSFGQLNTRLDIGCAHEFVEGIFLIASSPIADEYVIATGIPTELDSIASTIANQFGIANHRDYIDEYTLERKPNEANVLLGCTAKISSRLGWRPTKTVIDIIPSLVQSWCSYAGV